MNREAFTDWASVPLVCGVKDAARVLNRGVSTLYRQLEAGEFVPGVMPRHGQEPWEFSKKKLQEYVEGGYAKFSVVRRASWR